MARTDARTRFGRFTAEARETERLRAEQNAAGKKIGAEKDPAERQRMIAEMKGVADRIDELAPALRDPGILFDSKALIWIGNPAADNNTVATWHTTGVTNMDEARKKEVVVGSTGPNTSSQIPYAMNATLGTQFKIVRGYQTGPAVDLAIERGAFPLLNADLYLAAPHFASRLPEELKARIRQHGLRNSHLLSIAPTGTISLAFADNASNGIEPPYSWTYQRKKREADGTHGEIGVAPVHLDADRRRWRVLVTRLEGAERPLGEVAQRHLRRAGQPMVGRGDDDVGVAGMEADVTCLLALLAAPLDADAAAEGVTDLLLEGLRER